MDKILVPVDGSDQSVQAARWAAQLAARTGGSLILLHVHDGPGSETMGLSSLSRREIEESGQRIAGPSFERARAAIGSGVSVETLVSLGHPADEIVALARKHAVNLIVMGSRGLSPVREILLGSVSEKVIRHAHCAVTVVR
jgi:nucleotide-binding universal stress UspA family protein